MPAGTRAVWTVEVLSEELALRQSLDGPVQALRGQPGGMRKEVLQQAHHSVLRKGRVLSEESILLSQPRQPEMLPNREPARASPSTCTASSVTGLRENVALTLGGTSTTGPALRKVGCCPSL